MNELIYKRQALDAINRCRDDYDLSRQEQIDDCKNAVRELPPVTERPTGHWIEDAESYYKAINDKGGGVDENTPYFTDDIACSECLSLFSVIENRTELFDYCPHCGAHMEGGETE